jgi:hypothetical protein
MYEPLVQQRQETLVYDLGQKDIATLYQEQAVKNPVSKLPPKPVPITRRSVRSDLVAKEAVHLQTALASLSAKNEYRQTNLDAELIKSVYTSKPLLPAVK